MPDDDYERNYERGRKRLLELLPWARAEARKQGVSLLSKSPLIAAQRPYMREDNIDTLLIYRAPLGGWHVDLVLKSVPRGIPNSLGSPAHSPYHARAEAEEAAKGLLVVALAAEAEAVTAPSSPPVFMLHDAAVELVPAFYEIGLAHNPERMNGFGSKEEALRQLDRVMETLFPEGFTFHAAIVLSQSDRALLMTALHVAALSGIYIYPPRRHASPSGHAAPPDTRH